MSDLRTVLTETLRQHEPKLFADDDQFAVLADIILSLPGVAVTQLPEQPSEYWGPQHQPQWNNYPFTRVGGDEIEIGARSEYVYRVNVAEARTHAADLLAAVRVIEPAEVTS